MFPETFHGRRLLPPGNPEEHFKQKIASIPSAKGTLFLIPSPLGGWAFESLAQAMPECFFLLTEAEELLRRETKQACKRLFTTNNTSFFWFDPEVNSWEETLNTLPWSRIRRIETLSLSGGRGLNAPWYKKLEEDLKRELGQFWSNRLTLIQFGSLWVRNLFTNLPLFSCAAAWPQWGTDPVIVCGAGTSLENLLPLLGSQRQKVRILAADTALSCLKSWNIKPDAVVALESQQYNAGDFIGWGTSKVPVFCDLTVYPPTTHLTQGPIFWFSTFFTRLSLWDRLNQSQMLNQVPLMPALGSVGATAVAIALKLTQGPIILSGLDFSFPTAKSHAKDSPSLARFCQQSFRLKGSQAPGNWLSEIYHNLENPAFTSWLTSLVMQGYKNSLQSIIDPEKNRLYFWGPSPTLNISEINPQEWDWSRLSNLKNWTASQEAYEVHDWQPFIQEELQRLKSFYTQLNLYNQTQQNSHELKMAIQELDHLYCGFPDPEIRLDSGWLSRFLACAAVHRTHMSQLCQYS